METCNRRCPERSKGESLNEKAAASLLGSSHTSHLPSDCKFHLQNSIRDACNCSTGLFLSVSICFYLFQSVLYL